MGLGLVSGPVRVAEPRKAEVQLRRRVRVRPVRGRRPETGLSVRDIERPRRNRLRTLKEHRRRDGIDTHRANPTR